MDHYVCMMLGYAHLLWQNSCGFWVQRRNFSVKAGQQRNNLLGIFTKTQIISDTKGNKLPVIVNKISIQLLCLLGKCYVYFKK